MIVVTNMYTFIIIVTLVRISDLTEATVLQRAILISDMGYG